MTIKHLLVIATFAVALPINAIDYTTAGDGTTYTMQTLASIDGSGVTAEGTTYVVSGTCTIAVGDHFVIDSGATIAFDDNASLLIKGTADLLASRPTTLTRHGEAIITGNHIEDNLWGITVIGCGNVNIGKTEVDNNDPDYNPGGNVFADNGNNDKPYDLYNNSINTVYAQGNLWSVTSQDKELIEEVIYHQHDDATLGEVIFMPAADPAGISLSPYPVSPDIDGIYDLRGIRLNPQQKPSHGLYIINGRKVLK